MAAAPTRSPATVSTICFCGFGLTLKPEQLKVVESCLEGKDVFAVLPTGFGKSICFQCLPECNNSISRRTGSIVIVVVPLLGIIDDQVLSARKKGLQVALVTSETQTDVIKGVLSGKFELVFFTPETVLTKRWRNLLSTCDKIQENLVAIVFDEAHCISKWGYTFREEMKRIGELRSIVPSKVPVMALTATATRRVRHEVSVIIGMRTPTLIAINPDKPAIHFMASEFESIPVNFLQLAQDLRKYTIHAPRVLIYCKRIIDCDAIYDFFERELKELIKHPTDRPDLSKYRLVDKYTSITDACVKENIVTSFTSSSINNNLRVVISTISFGMGVNCQDVTRVINVGPPSDCSDYIQQCGRASRSGFPADAILLYNKFYNQHSEPNMKNYCTLKDGCRRNYLFSDFDNYVQPDIFKTCKCCDLCAKVCYGCIICQ